MNVLTKRLIATTVVVIFFGSSKVLASNQNFRQNKKSIFLEKEITLHFEDFQSYKGFGIFDPSLIKQKKSNFVKSIFVKINIDKMKNNILKEGIIYDNSVNNHLIEKESINNVKKILKIGLSKSIIQYFYIGFTWLSINQFYKFLSSYKPHPANVARFNKFFYKNLRGGYDDSDSSFKNLLEDEKQESIERKQELIQAKTDKYITVITQNNSKFKILQDLVFGLRFIKYIISQITQEIIAFLHVTFDYTYLFLENKQVSGFLTTISFYLQSKQLIFLLRCFNGLAVAGPFAAFTMVISISSQSVFIILQLKMMIDFSDFKDPKIRDMNEWLLITRNPIPLLGYYLPKALLEMAFDTTVQKLLKFHLGENHNTVSKILVNNVQNLFSKFTNWFLTLKKLK